MGTAGNIGAPKAGAPMAALRHRWQMAGGLPVRWRQLAKSGKEGYERHNKNNKKTIQSFNNLLDGLTAASRLQLCCSSPPFSYSPWMFGSCMISGATAWQTLPPSGYQCIHTCLIATDCFVIPAVAIIWGNLWLVRMTSTRDLLFNTAVVSWTVRINRQIAALVSREKKQKRARLKRNWYHYMLLGRKDRGPSPVHSS